MITYFQKIFPKKEKKGGDDLFSDKFFPKNVNSAAADFVCKIAEFENNFPAFKFIA